MTAQPPTDQPLRIFCLEDNPLIVFHLEQMLEDLGHKMVGTCDSFTGFKLLFDDLAIDGVLIDIDLKDGSTGPSAAAWLKERGIASIFVTGQERVAQDHKDVALAIVGKPINERELGQKLQLFRQPS